MINRSYPAALVFVVPVVLLCGCGQNGTRRVEDPIADVPANQQRTVNRSELRYAWPLSVGAGTLGCVDNAVVFRANGVSYALNDAAASRGFAAVAPIRQSQGSGPPANPLRRLTQDNRMRIFSAFASCEGANAADCQRRVRIANALSEAEMTQIDAEGKERFWPPLEPKQIDLQPLIDAGVKLCGRS